MTSTSTPPRRASIADVARVAGVSRAAVSKVIRNAYGVSPAMRERVESTIVDLGYRPRVAARAMRGASFTIGFMIPNQGNDFFNQLTDGVIAGLDTSAYQVIVAPCARKADGTRVLESLLDRQVDGIISIPSVTDPGWLEQLGAQVPLVIIGRHDPSQNYDTVTGDDALGIGLALDHLEELGHRRITHLTIPEEGPHAAHTFRTDAFRRRCVAAGRAVDIVRASDERTAYEATRRLLDRPSPPTAIVAGFDTLAIGVLRATTERGLDASSVSVVGYDGIDLASHPLISLSTVDQRGRQMGAEVIEVLMQRIAGGRDTPVHRQITPQLVARRSSTTAA